MDTKNQFWVFSLCIAVGFVGGIIYEALHLLFFPFRLKREQKWVRISTDVLFWLTFLVFAVWTAYFFHYPAFRVYMWIGYCLGAIIYRKTLRRIVAFLEKICYNKLIKRLGQRRSERKSLKKAGENYDRK